MRLQGIHHISAITGDAQRNLDFYTRVLGLRLVAKTVNQDDPNVYHLFYADEQGHPGSEMTFFEYPHAIPGRPGAGMIHRIVWRVGSDAALVFWAQRLPSLEVPVTRGAEGSVVFSDPEGLEHELVVDESGDAPLIAGAPDIPAEHALQGFEGVRAYATDPERSGALLEKVLGAERSGDDVWTLRGERRGGWIAYDPAPAERGRQSGGSVHHIAWGTTVVEHPEWQDRITAAGVHTSGIIDRTYFKSIYFREPSGVLFEIADDAPGFTIDSPVEELGRKIILPPQFEGQRERIERRLTPLPDPGPRPAAAT
ncbi:Putative ring-cleaving dioxygenase MhqA [Baekduia alba]|uniref:VOC family protein n=1 Tax=Baekduia alba TaxID=2997333 RepID=UPI0023400A28|nr:VOC family protein [Baekduia alba]WCB96014.1 Putative ring-cleaving dioxygenase MhqA [Baekduia alba]